MKITFYGAAGTVTGSKHMVEANGTRILLDCGLFQGARSDTYTKNRTLPFAAPGVEICVLSHAHIDHSGNIPNLVKSGFKGDIICTSATRDLCAAMLVDSGHIQERDAEFVNKRRKKRGEGPVEPIYTQADALESLEYFSSQGYNRSKQIAKGIWLTFVDAGHMLGSASVILDIEDHEAHKDYRLVFSGDIGRAGIPIIRDPVVPDGADVLIMESTYGDRLHEPYQDAEKELERIVNETYRRGGSIVMPAFAVGRTQQIVYSLHQLVRQGDIPPLPIYVDSPLAVNATAVFSLHPECYDDETRQFVMQPGAANPFGFDELTYIRTVEESKQLNFKREPCLIVSASGMAEFGRVLHHLRNRIEDPATTVLITGWQAPDTLGRRLVDGKKNVRIFGEEYQVNAHVEVLSGFSGHADRDELLDWVRRLGRKPQRTFLVHGEDQAATALAAALQDKLGIHANIPAQGQSVVIQAGQ